MGRPKIKIIDDSAPEAEEKKTVKKESAKSEPVKTSGEVEQSAESVIASEAKQSLSRAESRDSTSNEEIAASHGPRNDKNTKPQKPGKTKPRGKKYQELTKELDRNKSYSLTEAVDAVKKLSYTKFPATLEAHVNTAQTGIRGLVSLPFASGRKLRILAFGEEAEKSGADITGTDETIEQINKGKIDFDILVTTPAMMPKLAKVARILGPRGLMPNPKNGTITQDLKRCVEGFQAGKTEYRTEPKAPVIHLALGKLDQPTEELTANIKSLLQTLGKSRVRKVTLSPTMGPSVKLDLSSM